MVRRKPSKARTEAIKDIRTQWRKFKSKQSYRRKQGIELSPPFEYNNLNEIKKLDTRKIKSLTKKLAFYNRKQNPETQAVKVNDEFYIQKSILIDLENVERETRRRKKQYVEESKATPIFSQGEQITDLFTQNLLTKPNTSYTRYLKPYDISIATKASDVKKALENRRNRLSDEYVRKKQETMLNNFITSLERRFNSLADDVIEKLRQLDPEDFYSLYIQVVEIDFKDIPSNEEAITEDDYMVLDSLREVLEIYDPKDNIR